MTILRVINEKEKKNMRKSIVYLVLALLVFPVTAQEFSVSQGVSYVPFASSTNVDYSSPVSDPTFGSNTSIAFDSKYVEASASFLYAGNYRDAKVFVKPQFALTDHLALISELSYEYSFIPSEHSKYYTFTNISEHDVVLNFGAELSENLFDVVDFKASALVGYTPIYKDFRNINSVKFKVEADIYKYASIYFSIESFQTPESFANFNVLFVKNSYGINLHYAFNEHFTVFGDWQYYCAHPEKAWNIKNTIYNKNVGVATAGVKYTF